MANKKGTSTYEVFYHPVCLLTLRHILPCCWLEFSLISCDFVIDIHTPFGMAIQSSNTCQDSPLRPASHMAAHTGLTLSGSTMLCHLQCSTGLLLCCGKAREQSATSCHEPFHISRLYACGLVKNRRNSKSSSACNIMAHGNHRSPA